MGNIFKKNIELDAQLVLASMQGGIDGLMNFGYLRRDIFITTDMVIGRADWLKKQNKKYINKVSVRAAELEKEKARIK